MVSSDIAISRENEVNARGLYTIQIIDQTGTRRSDLVIEKECSHEVFGIISQIFYTFLTSNRALCVRLLAFPVTID